MQLKKIKKFSNLKKLLFFIVLFFTLIGLFFGCYMLYLDIELSPYHSVNKQIIDNVLTDLSNENYERAYARFTAKHKEEANVETYKRSILPFNPLYLDYVPNSFVSTKMNRYLYPINPAQLEYQGQITYKNGEKAPVTAVFIWEDDTWGLYILEFTEPNSRFKQLKYPDPKDISFTQ